MIKRIIVNRNTGYHYINIWLALRSISVTWEWVINLNRLNDKGHQKQNITELRQMTQPLSIKLMNRKRKDADIEKERFIEEKPTNPLSPLVKKKNDSRWCAAMILRIDFFPTFLIYFSWLLMWENRPTIIEIQTKGT